jgi:hypothetical protein
MNAGSAKSAGRSSDGLKSAVLLAAVCLGSCQTNSQRSLPAPVPTAQATQSPAARPTAAPPINALTGQAVIDESLLEIPAVLISISHFPATARPQSGLSFAPWVYEFYITEGATRFLAVFYGQLPAVAPPVYGGCETRTAPFVQTATLIGNLVWLDTNGNGLQDAGEGGISGLCVNLYDEHGNMIDRTSTDSNGYYGFNVEPGKYTVEFLPPAGLKFTTLHAGDDARGSDANPGSGRASVDVSSDVLSVDAGLVPTGEALPTPSAEPSPPAAQVGPIRSGRLIYRYLAHYFQNSCLIYGSASPEVLARLPKCLIVFHTLSGGGFMLDLDELRRVAKQNARDTGPDFDYSGNYYDALPPPAGAPAGRLHVFIAYQNQSAWVYDPLYQSYIRYVDTSEYAQAGLLHPDVDRLTGRQLHVENIIVMYAQHDVVSPTNLDIRLDPGKTGRALLFRDGQVFKVQWKTISARDEAAAGVHPIQFVSPDDKPLALKPGHTWVLVVTPNSAVVEVKPGQWELTFAPPPGAK